MTYEEFWHPLTGIYDTGEAKAVARMVLEVHFHLSMTDILCGKVTQLSAKEQELLEEMQKRLLCGEPVQYVLGLAEFGPRTFEVAPSVLIPRPETYALCEWVVASPCLSDAILDIGTGSGCIACTLAAELPHARVTAWDVSDAALAIARKNARRLGVKVRFEKTDILSGGMSLAAHQKESLFSCIVSNPPYICQREAADMERQVLDYEPSLALFVPDDDPLLFYRAIADFAVGALRPQGCLFFEINPLYARQIEAMLHAAGFTGIETRRDLFGRERFTKAIKI